MLKCKVMLIILLSGCLLSAEDLLEISTSEELIELFSKPLEDVHVSLKAGEYHLKPVNFIDETCGNCEDVNTSVNATYGLKVSGENISITAPADHSAIIHTHSGYGLYIVDCLGFSIENTVLTSGIRDTAAMASDAAIVVKRSYAKIDNNIIRDNIGDSLLIKTLISGIMGICGRELSILDISNNIIQNNSWDGIALYHDSEAFIDGNRIENGRGVAIGVTWDAEANIFDNYITRYWKGIGFFVDASGMAQYNIIENMYTWGISLWDAGKGYPRADFNYNIIYDTGAMGASITSSTIVEPGSFSNNIIVKTAQNPAYDSPDYYGNQCALAIQMQPEFFEIKDNIFYDNRRATDDLPDHDLAKDIFYEKLNSLKWVSELKFLNSSSFYSDFLKK